MTLGPSPLRRVGPRAAPLVALLAAAPVAAQAPEAAPAANELAVKARAELLGERDEKEGRPPEESRSIDAARLEVRYERERWLDAVLEVDVADGIVLKDAFARLGTRHLATRAGQFKPPVSAVELESSWTLPLLRRGIVHQALEDWMRFTGRRPGVEVHAGGDRPLRPALDAGAFQGVGADGALLPDVGELETGLAARASVRPGPLELGAFATLVGTEPMPGYGMGRYWDVGADAVLDAKAGGFGFRAWADGHYGTSFYALGLVGLDGRFAMGRVLAAVRWGGLDAGRPYVEAFGLAEKISFDLETAGSTLSNAIVGLNVGLWKRLRLGVQVEERRSGDASPPLSDGGNPLRDRRAYLVELGGSLGHAWRF